MTPYHYESATQEQRALGSLWWCIHHNRKLEALTEPVENRVRAIRETKAPHEQETRLRALRPASVALASASKAYDEAVASAWAAECADVPWGPNGLVFPEVTR